MILKFGFYLTKEEILRLQKRQKEIIDKQNELESNWNPNNKLARELQAIQKILMLIQG